MNNWYTYRHRRNDTNKVFYVGIGKTKNRPYSKSNRNKYWHNTSNLGYSVEIIATHLSKEEASELEMFLISLYGRRDLGLGTLVNMTDGGEGTVNIIWSETSRKKKSEEMKGKLVGDKNPMYGRKISDATKEKIRIKNSGTNSVRYGVKHTLETVQIMTQRKTGKNNPRATCLIDTVTGIIYSTVKEASEKLNINRKTLSAYLTGRAKNKTNLKYLNESTSKH